MSDAQIEVGATDIVGNTSGHKFVTVVLVPAEPKDTDIVYITVNNKLNDYSINPKNRSHANKIGGTKIILAPNAIGTTVEHEFAHVFGAGDQYKGGIAVDGHTLKKDVPGPINLMKRGSQANTQTLNEIYNSRNMPKNTQVKCTKLGGYCTQ